ncbi:Uu.00g115790.m01.CDS01, partial [Anthostomella pinea]
MNVDEDVHLAGISKTETPAEAQRNSDPRMEGPTVKQNSRNVGALSRLLIVFSILSSAFLVSLDNTIVADVQPLVVRDFS